MKTLTATNKKYISKYGESACLKAYEVHLGGEGAYESAYQAIRFDTNTPSGKGRIIGDGLINSGRILAEKQAPEAEAAVAEAPVASTYNATREDRILDAAIFDSETWYAKHPVGDYYEHLELAKSNGLALAEVLKATGKNEHFIESNDVDKYYELLDACKQNQAEVFEFEGSRFKGQKAKAVAAFIARRPSDKFYVYLSKNYERLN